MKGVSPLIAGILLIAFAVAVGGIVSVWLTSLTTTTTAGAESHSEAVLRCSRAGFEILSADSVNNKIVITVAVGDVEIYPKTVRFDDGTVNTTFSASPNVLDAAGEVSTISVTFPSGVTGVSVSGICKYGTINTTIEASCYREATCWA